VPRQNPIPEREVEICERLRQARLATHLSRVAFARQLGVDSSRLASYELGRVPIRMELALKAAAEAGVSLRWLAEGAEPRKLPIFPDQKLIERAGNGLFSEAYDAFLKPFFDAEVKNLKAMTGGKLEMTGLGDLKDMRQGTSVGILGPDEVLKLSSLLIKNLVWSIPPQLCGQIYGDIATTIQQFHRHHRQEIERFPKHLLPKFPSVDNSEKRKSEPIDLGELLERVRVLVAAKGMKARLAAELGVPHSRVREWLSGKYEPSGEVTLRLLRWVGEQG
jgi:transcriptional regulator with XRE-family HTH domain